MIRAQVEKTGLRGFGPGRTQTGLYSDRGLNFQIQEVEELYYL